MVDIPTPECDKLHAVSEKSQLIGEFLEWLCAEEGITLTKYHEHDDNCESEPGIFGGSQYICREGYHPIHTSIEKLLAKFFEIDLNKVERERRAILDALHGLQRA